MRATRKLTNVTEVRETWGDALPDWVLLLAEQADASGQKAVALAIGYSTTVVNQVLKNQYSGDLASVEGATRGAFQNLHVECPVLGPLPRQTCLTHQRTPFAATNPDRVRLWKACNGGQCPHSRKEKT